MSWASRCGEFRFLVVTLCCAWGCSQTSQNPPTGKDAAAKPLFALKVEDSSNKVRFYVTVRREGPKVAIYQCTTLAAADKEARAYDSARTKAVKHLNLNPGEIITRTAAFTELAFRRPNLVSYIGSISTADSTTRVFETTKSQIPASGLADKGKLHLFAYLESSKRGFLYSFTINTKTDRLSGPVRVNDARFFRRVNAFHVSKIKARGRSTTKNLYLDLLNKLQPDAQPAPRVPAPIPSERAHFLCPKCKKTTLAITGTLELPPDGYSDEISLQLIECLDCNSRGVAAYEESRRGSRERVHHLGGWLSAKDFVKVAADIRSCSDPRNRRCTCPVHKKYNQVKDHSWLGLKMFKTIETFPMDLR